MERPNTVAGLIEKRRVTLAHLRVTQADAQRLTADLDALDHVLALFAPEIDGHDLKGKRLPSPYAAKRGELRRIALDLLRETGGPITSLMVAERFCAGRGLTPEGRALTTVRNRVSHVLGKMKASGVVRDVPLAGAYRGWVSA